MQRFESFFHSVGSFRNKQRLVIMLACLVVLMASFVCFLVHNYISFNRESVNRLVSLSDIVAIDVGAALTFGDDQAIARSLVSLRADPSIKQFFVLNEQGRISARYSQDTAFLQPEDNNIQLELLRKKVGASIWNLAIVVERPIYRDGSRVGTTLVEQDSRVIADKIMVSAGIGVIIMLFSLAISYFLAERFQRVVTEPLIDIAKAMRDVSLNKDFSKRVAHSDTEEIDQLSDSFNEMLSEISQRDDALLKRQAQLHEMANFDSLTKLPNRTLFNDRLEKAIQRAERAGEVLAILFIDLDDFKLINDTHGHKVGDILLQETAQRLSRLTRADDTLARLGGDEFIIFLQNVKSFKNAQMVARKHIKSLFEPYIILDNSLFVSASIGVALYPEHGTTVDLLVKCADTAMYLAKEKGKNNVELFSSALHLKVSERLGLGNDLHRALEQGELELYYQPRINLQKKCWAGAEALIRWNHPVLGLIPPDKFIPLAESTGQILAIGEWVIREACHQLQKWHLQGVYLPRLSVNVSPLQLQRQNLIEIVKESIVENRLCVQALELEITEGALMENFEHSVGYLRELQRLGVQISIDDFGTGYSSLSQLRHLPVNVLKIDRSFLQHVHEDEEDNQLLAAIISMARSLHLEVVAEGIEYAEQEAYLLAHDCYEVQGYYYARPMPVDKLTELFLSTHPRHAAVMRDIDRVCCFRGSGDAISCNSSDLLFCRFMPDRPAACGGKVSCQNPPKDSTTLPS